MTTESPDCKDDLGFRYHCHKGAIFGNGDNTVCRESDEMVKCRTQLRFGNCTVTFPQHWIPFQTKFVGDTASDGKLRAVNFTDGRDALISFPIGYPFKICAKLVRRTV